MSVMETEQFLLYVQMALLILLQLMIKWLLYYI